MCREFIQPSTTERKDSKNWENESSWLVHDEEINGALCRVCKQTTAENTTQHTGGVWVTKPFQNWKKATERMKAHERSSLHTQASQALLVISTGFSCAATTEVRYARKREEQTCNEIACTLHSLSYRYHIPTTLPISPN